jgi:hypothetical protein
MQAAYTDQLLGTIVQRLRRTGLYDRSLLVVTADHGMAFTPGEQGRARVSDGTAGQVVALQGLADRVVRLQDGYLDWFRVGPHADLVGRRVGDLTVGADGGTARVVGLGDYRHVDPASGWVPAQVGGQLTSTVPGIPARPAVAVAVNGVIGASRRRSPPATPHRRGSPLTLTGQG